MYHTFMYHYVSIQITLTMHRKKNEVHMLLQNSTNKNKIKIGQRITSIPHRKRPASQLRYITVTHRIDQHGTAKWPATTISDR